MFKWICLLVAVAALSVFGWMLNDMRIEVKRTTERIDKEVMPVIAKAERVTDLLDRHLPKLVEQTDKAATTIDLYLPKLMAHSEQAAATINSHLPKVLIQTERAVATLNDDLPQLLASAEKTVDNLGELTDTFKQYKGLMGIVHVANQNKELLTYGSSILGMIGGLEAKIGVKKTGSESGLKQPLPAREWASAAKKDAQFLSLVAGSKAEILQGLAKSKAPAPLHIQVGDAAPRPLADWIMEKHPESKDVK